jgi:hypothetical protein
MLIDINNIENHNFSSLYFDSINEDETTLICNLKIGTFDPYYKRITLEKFNNKIEDILFIYECDTFSIRLKNTYYLPIINAITIDTLSFKNGIYYLDLDSLYEEHKSEPDVYIAKFSIRKNDED